MSAEVTASPGGDRNPDHHDRPARCGNTVEFAGHYQACKPPQVTANAHRKRSTNAPALSNFYAALNDDQKARFNTMGKQLYAENHWGMDS
jgi:hypothetical protein